VIDRAELGAICAELRKLHAQQPHETKHDLVRIALEHWMSARVEVLIASIDYMEGAYARRLN